jgi:hypothetical protein
MYSSFEHQILKVTNQAKLRKATPFEIDGWQKTGGFKRRP